MYVIVVIVAFKEDDGRLFNFKRVADGIKMR